MKRRSFALGSLALLMPCTVAVVASCSSSSSPPPLGTTPGYDASFFDVVNTPHPDGASEASPDVGVDAPVDAPADVRPDVAPVRCSDGGAPPCPDGNACGIGSDCVSGVCSGGFCKGASCNDSVKNGNETDVDCGGPNCSPCADHLHCKLPTDCQSAVCTGDICQSPTCQDGVKNGGETDVDCGNGAVTHCGACLIGRACGGPADCTTSNCVNGKCACPQGMTIVPQSGSQLGGDYCMDIVEVTKADYSVFNNVNPPHNTEPPECAFNKVWTPGVEWPPNLTNSSLYNGGEPVRGVDWCDALAYCKYNNKHLCGKIGGGAAAPSSYADASQDEWFNACSQSGGTAFPYGNAYIASACNDTTQPPAWTAPGHTESFVYLQRDVGGNLTGEIAGCIGGAVGLYDMSGDVAEWENACTPAATDAGTPDGGTGSTDTCLVRGGSYKANGDPTQLRCDAQLAMPRDTQDAAIGFRCCL